MSLYQEWECCERLLTCDFYLTASGMIGIALGPNLRESNVKAGVSEAEMDEMREGWAEWMKLDEATLTMLHGEVIITK